MKVGNPVGRLMRSLSAIDPRFVNGFPTIDTVWTQITRIIKSAKSAHRQSRQMRSDFLKSQQC